MLSPSAASLSPAATRTTALKVEKDRRFAPRFMRGILLDAGMCVGPERSRSAQTPADKGRARLLPSRAGSHQWTPGEDTGPTACQLTVSSGPLPCRMRYAHG